MKPQALLWLAASMFLSSPQLQAAYVYSWGNNFYGLTNVPAGLTNVVAIAAGAADMAVTRDGRVVEWGPGALLPPPTVAATLTNVVAGSVGYSHSLALKADGTVVAWGDNTFGQCNVPPNLSGVIAVAAGGPYSVALTADGTVTVWAQGPETNVPSDLTNVIAISSYDNILALRGDGTVAAWGDNQHGECNVPADLTNAIAISCGGFWSVALRRDGTLTAWGDNTFGQCNIPADLTNVIAVSAGWGEALALKADGTVVDWGYNYESIVPGLTGVTAVCVAKGPNNSWYDSFLALASVPPVSVAISFIAPLSRTVVIGSQAFFSVSATGIGALRYQWYFGTNPILGATNSWLALNNAQTAQSGSYSVMVSDSQSSAMSQSVTLSVQPWLDVHMVPEITIKGGVGSTYEIDYLNAIGPTNAWNALATITLTNAQQFYFDVSAFGQPTRIYRLVQLP
jgi:hypothetical protein